MYWIGLDRTGPSLAEGQDLTTGPKFCGIFGVLYFVLSEVSRIKAVLMMPEKVKSKISVFKPWHSYGPFFLPGEMKNSLYRRPPTAQFSQN